LLSVLFGVTQVILKTEVTHYLFHEVAKKS